jgi:hypothetical protein
VVGSSFLAFSGLHNCYKWPLFCLSLSLSFSIVKYNLSIQTLEKTWIILTERVITYLIKTLISGLLRLLLILRAQNFPSFPSVIFRRRDVCLRFPKMDSNITLSHDSALIKKQWGIKKSLFSWYLLLLMGREIWGWVSLYIPGLPQTCSVVHTASNSGSFYLSLLSAGITGMQSHHIWLYVVSTLRGSKISPKCPRILFLLYDEI